MFRTDTAFLVASSNLVPFCQQFDKRQCPKDGMHYASSGVGFAGVCKLQLSKALEKSGRPLAWALMTSFEQLCSGSFSKSSGSVRC